MPAVRREFYNSRKPDAPGQLCVRRGFVRCRWHRKHHQHHFHGQSARRPPGSRAPRRQCLRRCLVRRGAGQVVLTTTTVNNNSAVPSERATGYGGGLFIGSGATVDVDAFTLANVINNTAPIDPNIDGTYIET